MRYWYAPLKPEPGNLFQSEKNEAGLYVGEISQEEYNRIKRNRALEQEEELDELGLPNKLDEDDLGID